MNKLFLYLIFISISLIFILSPFKALFTKLSINPSINDLELSLFSTFFTAYSINLLINSFLFFINISSISFSFISSNSISVLTPFKSILKFSVSFGIFITIFSICKLSIDNWGLGFSFLIFFMLEYFN